MKPQSDTPPKPAAPTLTAEQYQVLGQLAQFGMKWLAATTNEALAIIQPPPPTDPET